MVSQPPARLDKIAIVVDDYDQAIGFFTKTLGFERVEDSPSLELRRRRHPRPARSAGPRWTMAGTHFIAAWRS
jgi:catechol 2,3-dioxygenase-like lactoylglutathione lyase family enzyme